MADLVGARVVVSSLDEQQAVLSKMFLRFEVRNVYDYLDGTQPYRALHVQVMIGKKIVETQIRTVPQQIWANESESYGEAAVRSAMEDGNTKFWLAEGDGTAVGFAMAVHKSPNPVTHSDTGVELRRVYLLSNLRGSGLGKKLYETVLEDAKQEGRDHIWLDVMDSADWAYGAYLRWGFDEIGTRSFDREVYEDRRKMILLSKQID